MENIIVHPDKIEAFFANSAQNAGSLSAYFHDLRWLWTDRWDLRWLDLSKKYDQLGRWKLWKILGCNRQISLFVQGFAYHLNETSGGTRLFREQPWLDSPFPNASQRGIYSQYRHFGFIRVTDCLKTEPYQYTASVLAILRDIQDIGAETFPRKLEIAMDISDVDLARDFRSSVRLRRSNPLGLVHFLPGLQGKQWIFQGPGANYGDREYEHFRGYVIDKIRQLALYPRWRSGFYRIELRLAQRALRRYIRSEAFLAARDPSISSVTLAVLATIPTILEENLVCEHLDLTRLYAHHPRLKALGLQGLSIRGQRFVLVRAGFSLQQINQFSVRLDMPPMTILTPHVAAGLLRGTVDHNQL